ncbi:Os06g0690800 [Oryza sativa Japonica Group]|uniref:Os06g0690800 protein n=1 Tax=Oryza sativa subsp. japonica TaxID=39947 RepID=A0A0P0X0R1_ORYSJ|nr:Os06g0690800 [Oryza sativa Japonica Group]
MQLRFATVPPPPPPLPLSTHRPFPHLRHHRCPRRSPPPATKSSPLLRARRSLPFTPRAHGDHHHGHCHCHHHHNDRHKVGVHGHGAGGGGAAVMRVARAIGWADVADALREHLQVSCISIGLLLVAAACPHMAALNFAKRLQATAIAIALPLVGVNLSSAALVLKPLIGSMLGAYTFKVQNQA